MEGWCTYRDTYSNQQTWTFCNLVQKGRPAGVQQSLIWSLIKVSRRNEVLGGILAVLFYLHRGITSLRHVHRSVTFFKS